MKAIYMKPETEIVLLQVEEDIAWAELERVSQTENVVYSNDSFFDDEQNNGNGSFFDD